MITDPAIRAAPSVDPRGPVHAYADNLYRHLAACDLAVVRGVFTTTMDLVATKRPFLPFPLGHHFEQQIHVPRRLAPYGAGRRMDYAPASPEVIGSAIAEETGRPVAYRSLEPGAAGLVAARIGELL